LVNGTFWQVVINQRLGVPDALLPFFPMIRSLLSVLFFFTLIPRLTHAKHLKAPTLIGFGVYLAGQLLLVGIPSPDGAAVASTYALLAVCLILDAFGGGILFMLAESLVALHVDKNERSRVMAIQRTCVMLVTAPFGWISGWLSSMDRSWPFLLTSVLLVLGLVVAGRFWVTTHADEHDGDLVPQE
ncbi:MAG TPA: MFS transporter, partial [Arachnia sp.]|nr:MFS transporter [Arachnia sp.]